MIPTSGEGCQPRTHVNGPPSRPHDPHLGADPCHPLQLLPQIHIKIYRSQIPRSPVSAFSFHTFFSPLPPTRPPSSLSASSSPIHSNHPTYARRSPHNDLERMVCSLQTRGTGPSSCNPIMLECLHWIEVGDCNGFQTPTHSHASVLDNHVPAFRNWKF
jgi:hypothetical protein